MTKNPLRGAVAGGVHPAVLGPIDHGGKALRLNKGDVVHTVMRDSTPLVQSRRQATAASLLEKGDGGNSPKAT